MGYKRNDRLDESGSAAMNRRYFLSCLGAAAPLVVLTASVPVLAQGTAGTTPRCPATLYSIGRHPTAAASARSRSRRSGSAV